ncbi:FAD-dependent monooxygenase [Nonomuraea zeae]|uniref:FAD-dependent monooxygenase n=1 Tax=Nonomuraea zeae TaxID=1642303 RepID=UPI00197F7751|nr:FAD-dependent monooxygenase [Nonomuraea zeae]
MECDGPPEERTTPVTAEELQAGLRTVSRVNVTITGIRTATRFTDSARQVTDYRLGRVLLAGDAVHVHSPFRYDLPGDHPLIGRSAPALEPADGTRLGDHLHEGRGLLLDLGLGLAEDPRVPGAGGQADGRPRLRGPAGPARRHRRLGGRHP